MTTTLTPTPTNRLTRWFGDEWPLTTFLGHLPNLDPTIRIEESVDRDGEMWLINATIPEYGGGNRFNHEPKRPRKLLLKQREIARLSQAVQREGMTLVPLRVYFNERGRAKIEIAIARGKQLHDKRETEKKRDWAREKGRLLRDRG